MGTTELAAATAWDSVADGWVEHHRHVAEGKEPVTRALLDAAALRPGHRVLELGAGPGELATVLADLVGRDGEVVATDVSPRMVDAAAAALADRPWASAAVADAADLSGVGDGFDAVVCRMGLMFVDPPERAFAEARRVLRPGGRLAASVWAGPQHNPWLVTVGRSAMAAGLPVAPPIGPGGPFGLSDAEQVEALAIEAGFADVAVDVVDVAMPFADAEAHVRISSALAPALAPVVAAATDEQRAAIVAAVADADAPHVTADGLRVPGRALVVRAARPAG